MKADISFFSGRPCHFLNPITTNPAFDIKSLFKKFLWISVILLFNLNLLIAYLIWAVFPLFSKLANTLRTDSFWAFDILSLSFSMLFSYLHLFKQSPTFALKFLNSWIKDKALISLFFVFNLNLLIAYLIWAVFPLLSKLANTLRTDSFWAFDILYLTSFDILSLTF